MNTIITIHVEVNPQDDVMPFIFYAPMDGGWMDQSNLNDPYRVGLLVQSDGFNSSGEKVMHRRKLYSFDDLKTLIKGLTEAQVVVRHQSKKP